MPENSKPKHRGRWSVLAALILAAAAAGLGQRLLLSSDRIIALTQKELAQHLNAKVEVQSATFHLWHGITLENPTLRDPARAHAPPIIKAKRVIIRPRLLPLLRGRIIPRSATIEAPVLRLSRNARGEWNVGSLPKGPLPRFRPLPAIHVTRGRLEFEDHYRHVPPIRMTIAHIRVTADPEPGVPDGVRLSASLDQEDLPRKHLDRCQARALFHLDRPEGEITLGVNGLKVSRELRPWLPHGLRGQWDALMPSAGTLDAKAEIALHATGDPRWTLQAALELHKLKLKPQRLPWPITDAEIRAALKQNICSIERLDAQVGPARVKGSGELRWRSGLLTMDVTLRTRALWLDPTLGRVLPSTAAAAWKWLRPQGQVAATARVTGPLWPKPHPAVDLELALDHVDLRPENLPLKVSRLTGRIRYRKQRIGLGRLRGKLNRGDLCVRDTVFDLRRTKPASLHLEVRGVEINEDLKQNIPERWLRLAPAPVRRWWPELRLGGALDAVCELRRSAGQSVPALKATLTLRNGRISHPKAPHAIRDLRGDIRIERAPAGPVVIRPQGLSGRAGPIDLKIREGNIRFSPEAPQSLVIQLDGVPLNKKVKALLPDHLCYMWDQLRPSGPGTLNISGKLEKEAGPTRPFAPYLTITLEVGGIRHAQWPYPLRNVSGRLNLHDRQIRTAELHGSNGAARIALTVEPHTHRGRPGMKIQLAGKGVPLDQQLRKALPTRFHPAWDTFKPTGVIDFFLTRSMPIHRSAKDAGGATAEHAYSFSASAALKDVALDAAVKVRDVRGVAAIQSAPSHGSGRGRLSGRLKLERAHVNQLRLSDLSLNFRSEDGVLHIENLTADCYDGTLTGRAKMDQAPRKGSLTYEGQVALKEADFHKLVLDSSLKIETPGRRMNASAEFTGMPHKTGSFTSQGRIHIEGPDVGKLPGLRKLAERFDRAQIRMPSFTTIGLSYRMGDKTIHAHKLELTGKTLSLSGPGRMDADRALRFRLTPKLTGLGAQNPKLKLMTVLLSNSDVAMEFGQSLHGPIWRLDPLIALSRLARDVAKAVLCEEGRKFVKQHRKPKRPPRRKAPAPDRL